MSFQVRPPYLTSPDDGSASVETMLRSVDLPAPFGPEVQ